MRRKEKILKNFLRREGIPLDRLPPVAKIFDRNPQIYQNYIKKPSLKNLTSDEEADMDRRLIYSGRESDVDGDVFYNTRSSNKAHGKKHKSKRRKPRRTREHNAKTKKGKANRLTRKKSTRKNRKH